MSKSQMEAVEKLAGQLAALTNPASLEFGQKIQRAVLVREAARLVERMGAFEEGELDWLSLAEAWEVLELARSSTTIRKAICSIRSDRLREVDADGTVKMIEALHRWVDAVPTELEVALLLPVDSEMDLAKDPAALGLAIAARRRGWNVSTGPAQVDSDLIRVELWSSTGDTVSLTATETPAGLHAVVRFGRAHAGDRSPAGWPRDFRGWRGLEVGENAEGRLKGTAPEVDEAALSVTDLFEGRIMLRDLEPRSHEMGGINDFREQLGWASTYLPRKNEPEYGQALVRIMGGPGLDGPQQIVYVGDTLLNDGGAIRGLQAAGPPGKVWGFLCGAAAGSPERDFSMDGIHFGCEWGSLAAFIEDAQGDGLVFDEGTWVLFDLDQTVYAAKGRDDEPLLQARWDAVRGYIESIVPDYKFDPVRAETLYREFDRDQYHPVTRDNLDYVVLLVLAVASGLADATEIREYASSSLPTIGALAEELRGRASRRVGHEDIAATLDAVKAVHYNTLAEDQTPCKDFRRFECLAMAARMDAGKDTGGEGRIFLNREVVDLITLIRETPARLFAVSDRPPEAAVIEPDDEALDGVDLMTVPMWVRGFGLLALDLSGQS